MDNPMAMKGCVGGCGCLSLLCFIFFIIMMSAYSHLGPDDQVLVKSSTGKSVVNGPRSHQFNPFQSRDWRKAILVNALQYAVVQQELTGDIRHEAGPQLLFLGAYDVHKSTALKLILEKHQYVRLVDAKTGFERVATGPQTIVPSPTEFAPNGKEDAVFVDQDTAVLVQDKESGVQRLVTDRGVFIPGPYEDIVAVRNLIHVLPHQALILRDTQGTMTVYSGAENAAGTAFFLPPYANIVRVSWSSYSELSEAEGQRADAPARTNSSDPSDTGKVLYSHMDLRAQKAFYNYEVRTSDNVKLRLEGTIFWQLVDVRKMISMTSDPVGDLWYHARSTLIQAVSNVTLSHFMSHFTEIVKDAFEKDASDGFYENRGLLVTSMELTRYQCSDPDTAVVLQDIIRETTHRINRLQKQESENEVEKAKLEAEIVLEQKRTELINTQALNSRLLAQKEGSVSGGRVAFSISSFIDGLNESNVNATSRVELYRLHVQQNSARQDTANLVSGEASLYVAPKEMDLRLQMPHSTVQEL
mmetsp:Transcript_66159/g.144241  ORF Transcript_66159/g.144241 Transcript_66159/m.144241 type:complete len:528 (+) Transcript_66159:78-1661(+)